MNKKTGLLLMNLGTPDHATPRDVWRYLRVFLMDRRVINVPYVLRFCLIYFVILPFRLSKTCHAYQSIWTIDGSPLRVHSEALRVKLQQQLGANYRVALGMRYGNPSIEKALDELRDCDNLIVLPLYPQYSSAATGSSLEKVLRLLSKKTIIPAFSVIPEFHTDPGFIKAKAALMKPYLDEHDVIVFSYHGLPEQHLQEAGCATICKGPCAASSANTAFCYRAQCYATTAQIVTHLGLETHQYRTAFQSRLGKVPWVQPYFDDVLVDLAQQNIKRIAVVCPSFVADCIETIEEIGIRAQATWLGLGGERLSLIPCLNADQAWCDAIVAMISRS